MLCRQLAAGRTGRSVGLISLICHALPPADVTVMITTRDSHRFSLCVYLSVCLSLFVSVCLCVLYVFVCQLIKTTRRSRTKPVASMLNVVGRFIHSVRTCIVWIDDAHSLTQPAQRQLPLPTPFHTHPIPIHNTYVQSNRIESNRCTLGKQLHYNTCAMRCLLLCR